MRKEGWGTLLQYKGNMDLSILSYTKAIKNTRYSYL